jgi:hypothetical protein
MRRGGRSEKENDGKKRVKKSGRSRRIVASSLSPHHHESKKKTQSVCYAHKHRRIKLVAKNGGDPQKINNFSMFFFSLLVLGRLYDFTMGSLQRESPPQHTSTPQRPHFLLVTSCLFLCNIYFFPRGEHTHRTSSVFRLYSHMVLSICSHSSPRQAELLTQHQHQHIGTV